MSELNTSGFQFPGMEDSDDLDVDAIFGGGASTSDINPFDPPTAQTEQPAAPQEQPRPESPAVPVVTPEPAPTTAATPRVCRSPEPPACGAARPTG